MLVSASTPLLSAINPRRSPFGVRGRALHSCSRHSPFTSLAKFGVPILDGLDYLFVLRHRVLHPSRQAERRDPETLELLDELVYKGM